MKAARFSWQVIVLLSVSVVLMFSHPTSAGAEVVYDNTSTPTKSIGENPYVPDGFWPFNTFVPNEPMGDQITLAGTARSVVEFDLVLSSTQLVNLSSLTLTFHDTQVVDSKGNRWPDNQLWTGTLTNVAVDGLTTVTFVVPDILAPDVFVWTAGADSSVAGLATFDPPTVGSSNMLYWDHDIAGNRWWAQYFRGDPVANFGAKVLAVPEPVTAVMLTIGGLSLIRRKRR